MGLVRKITGISNFGQGKFCGVMHELNGVQVFFVTQKLLRIHFGEGVNFTGKVSGRITQGLCQTGHVLRQLIGVV